MATLLKNHPADEYSLANEPVNPKNDNILSSKDEQSSNSRQARYIRVPYTPRTSVTTAPTVHHFEPRAVASHVNRRKDQRLAALPPPAKKSNAIDLSKRNDGGGEQHDQRRPGRDKDGEDDGDKEDGDDDDGKGNMSQVVIQEESEDEWASAPEDPWSDDIWDVVAEQRAQQETRTLLEMRKRMEELEIRKRKEKEAEERASAVLATLLTLRQNPSS
jgi:hypothetical protein